jgi:hypothetical protein
VVILTQDLISLYCYTGWLRRAGIGDIGGTAVQRGSKSCIARSRGSNYK